MLLGRHAECEVLDRAVEAVRAGESRVLVIRGEAGIGKTALLDYVAGRASGCRVVRAAGVESEMELAFAGLHQLCAPMLERLDRLPSPQADALATAFGLDAGDPPTRFLVGVAVLSLLAEVAEGEPLVCVVDDAHWLDRVSAQTLAFVARRLLAERVGLVFAVRESVDHEFAGFEELAVRGLHDDEARALLGSALTGPVDEQVRERIVAETRGNPLALLELTRGLTPTDLAGGFGPLGPAPMPGRIEEGFVARLEPLGANVRWLLLAAAADPVGDAALLRRALDLLGVAPDDDAEAAAEASGLVVLGPRVRFRHPLVRSAAYRSASSDERTAVHRALAEATDPDVDPDRRAWHRAAAAAGPDEEVALELERSAVRAQARGGLAAAAAFLQRCFALTQDPAKRAGRALAAAQASLQAGEFDATLGLLAAAAAGTLDGFQRARLDLMRGHVAFASGLGSDAPPLLLKAAGRLEQFDLGLARETYLTAWGAAVFAGPAGGGVLSEICRAVRALPASRDPAPLDLLLDGFAQLTTDGRAAATSTLQRAVKALAAIPVEDVLRWGWAATGASDAVWDDEGTRAIATRHVQLVREAGALAELPIHLAGLGLARAWTGDFAATAALVAESDSVAAATGAPIAPYALLRLQALQGSEAEALASIASAIELASAEGQGMAAAWAHWSAAVLYNGLARYAEAAAAARRATSDPLEPWASMWSLPELVEAAARTGDAELARDAFERLVETTQPSGTDFALGVEARSRALLSEGPAADRFYREAIDRFGRTQLRPELARGHLLYGEWLRREGRRLDAREELRTAHELLVAIGMEAFAERAARELLATGEKVRKRTDDTRGQLTAQEGQIAVLARDGLSNPEIGAQLFISPRTVEYHLHKVFAKLAISSRSELSLVLPSKRPEAQTA
jgi:DNA-binding CsgD family transcriptional regulator/tetratricopeptide (TPR) repeat protein